MRLQIVITSYSIHYTKLYDNSFIAIFPAIIFFFTIIPYIPIPHFQDNLLALLRDLIPFSVYETVESTLFDIVKRPRGGLLSLGFVLALYFATNGVNSLIEAFNQTYHSLENRSFVLQRLVSVLLVLVITSYSIHYTKLYEPRIISEVF